MPRVHKPVLSQSPLVAETATLVDRLIQSFQNTPELEAKLAAVLNETQLEQLRQLKSPTLLGYEVADIVDRFNYSLAPGQTMALAKVLKPIQVVTLLSLNKHSMLRQEG